MATKPGLVENERKKPSLEAYSGIAEGTGTGKQNNQENQCRVHVRDNMWFAVELADWADPIGSKAPFKS
jgi:hypothetical protein